MGLVMHTSIIVTGAAGFIGSNFVRVVRQRSPARIVVFDKLTYAGSLLNLNGLLDGTDVVFVARRVRRLLRGVLGCWLEVERSTFVRGNAGWRE